MRCYCCDNILTTQEATRKFSHSGVFTEMCNTCLGTIAVDTTEGEDFHEDEELFDDEGNPIDDQNK